MDYEIWSFFLSLESDLVDTCKYVHLSERNYRTFSSQYSKIILASASEFESVSKKLIKSLFPQKNPSDIGDIKESLLSKYPNIHKNIVTIARYGINVEPLSNWYDGGRLGWWDSYVNIKHDRNKNFETANLSNTLNALSALLVLNVFYYRNIFNFRNLSGNKLLAMSGMGETLIAAPSNDLPDEIVEI